MASDLRDPTGRLTAEFNRLDRYGDGTLSSDELFEGLRLKYEQDELSETFDKLDTNGDKNISLDEYLNYWFENGGADPRFGVMLVKGECLLRLSEHKVYGKMTSHQILDVLTKKHRQAKGKKSQKQIMVELGMFQDADFEIVTFDALKRNKSHTVLTYTWNDSPVGEQYGPLNKKMKEKGIDMSAQLLWIDIICLDQQHPLKMETIKRSNEIYAHAKYYFVICLACFNRLWCTMELACQLGGQNGVNTDVVVTDFVGFLKRREEAYLLAQLRKDPPFEACRYTSETDVPIVKEKILAKFKDIAAANLHSLRASVTGPRLFEPMSKIVFVQESSPSRQMDACFTQHTRRRHPQAPWREVAPRTDLYTNKDTHTDAQLRTVQGDKLG
jgi:hypothetical protein